MADNIVLKTDEECEHHIYRNINSDDEVLEFIKRRFPKEANWVSENCYYFAVILNNRFNGTIYYDVIYGHFVTRIGDSYFDNNGKVDLTDRVLVEWEKFDEYDSLQKQRIIRDCIR